ncbi:MAG: AraC family transcriptional regulator [Syntrophomonadaceae bacterium]|nr:AraC family transcriptional regulator [Syntrophomonadaceae bacterium]
MENKHGFALDRLNMLQASLQAVLEQKDLFSNIIDFFPYPIEVFARDGTTVMINRALLNEFKIPGSDMIIGKYNIFKDPEIEKAGLTDAVKAIFEGKICTVTDIKAPLEAIQEFYQTESTDVESMYQDALGFPIFDETGAVSHVVIMLMTRKIYRGKAGIAKSVEYLESNWNQEYNLSETAKAAGLSPYHFTRVFKNDMGMTPYSYYIRYKLQRLMEMLHDVNLSVKDAFEVCGMEYSGYSFGVFKKHVGVTPAQYREMIRQ